MAKPSKYQKQSGLNRRSFFPVGLLLVLILKPGLASAAPKQTLSPSDLLNLTWEEKKAYNVGGTIPARFGRTPGPEPLSDFLKKQAEDESKLRKIEDSEAARKDKGRTFIDLGQGSGSAVEALEQRRAKQAEQKLMDQQLADQAVIDRANRGRCACTVQ